MLPLLFALFLGGAPHRELLVFTADWCPACRQMEPIVDKLQREGFRVREMNVDRDPAAARRFGVTALPTFLVIEDGKPRDRAVGVTTEAHLRSMVPTPSPQRKQGPQERTPSPQRKQSRQPEPVLESPPRVTLAGAPGSDRNAIARDAASEPKPETPYPKPQPLALVRAASVKVSVRHGIEQWHGSGTCVWSDGRHAIVLTAAHVVQQAPAGRVSVTFADGLVLPAAVRFADSRRDIAVLVIESNRAVPSVALGATTLRPGTPVISIGYPGGGAQRVLAGRIVSVGRWSGFTEASMPAVQGHSGGGLFHDGDLVGVLWGSNETSLYASQADIRAALDRAGCAYVGRVTEETAPLVTEFPLVPKLRLGTQTGEAPLRGLRGSADVKRSFRKRIVPKRELANDEVLRDQ